MTGATGGPGRAGDLDAAAADIRAAIPDRLRDWWRTYAAEAVSWDELSAPFGQRGKLLRSRVLLLVESLCGGAYDGRTRAACVALEAYHTTSLVYDDIQDAAATRRGAPAHHTAYGQAAAMALCSLLTRFYFQVLADEPALRPAERAFLLSSLLRHQAAMAAGQMAELVAVRDGVLDVPEEAYLRNIAGKTGGLLGYACEAGAFLARPQGPPALWADMDAIGTQAGILYQVIDDFDDLFGSGTSGKPRLQDVREAKRTIFFLRARARLRGPERAELDGIYLAAERSEADVARASALIAETGVREDGIALVATLQGDFHGALDAAATRHGLDPLASRDLAALFDGFADKIKK